MGSRQEFQPLTREDKITVILYRVGIVLSMLIMAALAYVARAAVSGPVGAGMSATTDILVYGLFASVGVSVFFIHLYVGKFKKYLKYLYFISLGCLVILIAMGKGSLSSVLVNAPSSALLLLPLSGCLGFVTAKEAFCFQLVEGYLLAMIMPAYLVLVASTALDAGNAAYGLVFIAAMLILFTLRKVFMPIAYDIGDKSAYQ